jgi:hypothetical protein
MVVGGQHVIDSRGDRFDRVLCHYDPPTVGDELSVLSVSAMDAELDCADGYKSNEVTKADREALELEVESKASSDNAMLPFEVSKREASNGNGVNLVEVPHFVVRDCHVVRDIEADAPPACHTATSATIMLNAARYDVLCQSENLTKHMPAGEAQHTVSTGCSCGFTTLLAAHGRLCNDEGASETTLLAAHARLCNDEGAPETDVAAFSDSLVGTAHVRLALTGDELLESVTTILENDANEFSPGSVTTALHAHILLLYPCAPQKCHIFATIVMMKRTSSSYGDVGDSTAKTDGYTQTGGVPARSDSSDRGLAPNDASILLYDPIPVVHVTDGLGICIAT